MGTPPPSLPFPPRPPPPHTSGSQVLALAGKAPPDPRDPARVLSPGRRQQDGGRAAPRHGDTALDPQGDTAQAPWKAGGQLQCPARVRGKLVAFRSPLAPPPRQTTPPQFPLLPGAREQWEPALAGMGAPSGPAVSPDSGTARWDPGCDRAFKDNEGRGREPRGAGRFLAWFSGNWAGQDRKVLELACTV